MRRGKVARLLSAVQTRLAARRRTRFLKDMKPACDAPYPTHLYREFLLRALAQRGLQVRPFAANGGAHEGAALYVRHDIDTAECARNLRTLLDIDLAAGISPGVYFRADQEAYRLAECRTAIEPYRKAGFEIGLHTVCYAQDDYLGALRTETRVFSDAFGFAPSSFTVHGLGTHRFDVRTRFYADICARLEEFGYAFSDCCERQRAYDYVFHDSHLDAQRNARFIYGDLAGQAFPFIPGKDYVVLTHPCYWTPSAPT